MAGSIADRIEEARLRAGLSKYAVTRRAGIGEANFYRILRGDSGLGWTNAVRLAAVLGVSPSWLLDGKEGERAPALPPVSEEVEAWLGIREALRRDPKTLAAFEALAELSIENAVDARKRIRDLAMLLVSVRRARASEPEPDLEAAPRAVGQRPGKPRKRRRAP